ncbi:MAG: type II/IV secretion system ATPase subunit [Thaumarchaeota archaeon]|nr:type II/IV secretion system ATPase subunit [Nitrososphaerota archaeon]
MLKTKIDEMVELILQNRKIGFSRIAKELSWNEASVEKIALILEKAGYVRTHYPINMIEQPWATLLTEPEQEKESVEPEKIIEKYGITADGGRQVGAVQIFYSKKERRPTYDVTLAQISRYTRAYIDQVKIEVSKELRPMARENTSETRSPDLETRKERVRKIIEKDGITNEEGVEILLNITINEMYGLGELEVLIADTHLEEIVINSAKLPVSVYHRKHGWLKTNIIMKNEMDTENYAEQIARNIGKQISLLNPILDANLSTGDRVNATLFPISTRGNTITLRLFARNPWTMVSYLKKEQNSMSIEMAALLWQALHYEMNIIMAGGTASGKTSALNGLLALTPPFQRIVTIEDTRELVLPSYQWNWVPLVTRLPNPEGLGEVTMLDLVVNALRMRPDRIVMGEIRRKREAEVLFEAMHTGHSVYGTIHADTGAQVIKRLVDPPIEVPPSEVEDINLLVVQYRDRRKNLRRTLEISEVIPGMDVPELNRVYIWKPRTDTFQMVKPPHRYIEKMNLHTGMTEKEINEDQKEKVAILEWMAKNNLDNVEDVGKVMQVYYSEPDAVVNAAKKGYAASKVL